MQMGLMQNRVSMLESIVRHYEMFPHRHTKKGIECGKCQSFGYFSDAYCGVCREEFPGRCGLLKLGLRCKKCQRLAWFSKEIPLLVKDRLCEHCNTAIP